MRIRFLREPLTCSAGASDSFTTTFQQQQLIGAVAKLERPLIRERQREGIELAKERGVYKGRSKALTPEQVQQIAIAVDAGETKSAVATRFGACRTTLYEALRSRGAYGR